MAKEYNATCSICGNPYHKCLSCKDSMALKPWQVYTCSSTHYQVFMIVRGYTTGVYTKEEAKEKFKNINISDLETYREHIRVIIEDILKEDEKVVVEEKNEVETVEVETEVKNTRPIRKKYSKNELQQSVIVE